MNGLDTSTGNAPPKLSQGDRIFGEFATFGILAALAFGVVLGLPYLYRLHTLSWASKNPSSKTGYMGTWVGVLRDEEAFHPAPADQPDAPLDPFWSKEGQLNAREQNREQRAARQQLTKAFYLDISLEPFTLMSPTLRGEARTCDLHGNTEQLKFTVLSVADADAKMILYSDQSQAFGNLDLHHEYPALQARWTGFSPKVTGTLLRGDLSTFAQYCSEVKAQSTPTK